MRTLEQSRVDHNRLTADITKQVKDRVEYYAKRKAEVATPIIQNQLMILTALGVLLEQFNVIRNDLDIIIERNSIKDEK